jgi:nitrite reductase/ring-hydroxylating ferredoxin subunit
MMIRVTWFILLAVILSGCGKASNQVPDVAINLNLPLTDPRLLGLSSSGHGVILNGYGVSGLILYKTVAGQRIVAYDRCSTVNPEKRCAITLDEGAFTATDPCSGAKFLLEDGSPAKAPATISLKQYYVNITGNTLQVTN